MAAERPNPFREVARWLVLAAGATAFLIGAVHLTSWLLGTPLPRSTGAFTMKTNMALGLLLAGASLLLLRWRPLTITPLRSAAAVALASLVLLLGGLTLSQHLFGVDLGIDQLLASEPALQPGTTSPNRMGPPGALSLVLVGAGLLALAWNRSASSWLGVATCWVVLIPTVGMLYGVSQLYADPYLTAIAWPTILGLAMLGAALGLAESGGGSVPLLWRDDAGGLLLRRSLGPAILLPIGLGLLRLMGERAGLYERPVGTALLVVSVSVVSSLLLWQSAQWLSSVAAGRARAEAQSRWSEERFRALTTASSEVLYRMSPDWSEMQELRSRGLLATTAAPSRTWLQDYIHPDDQPQVRAAIEQAIKTRAIFQMEHRVHRADGGLGWISSRAVPLINPQGEIVEWFGAANDITERKRSEEALREANHRLQEMDRRKDEFLAVLSHELRNPLAPIRNSVSILERAPPGAEQAQRASQVIGRQVQHMTRLIDDLLDLTRISRGKITLQRERLELGALARATAEDYGEVFRRNGVELTVALPGEPLWVEGDPTRLAQVIGNLLSNAAKFTPRGGSTQLTLRTSAAGEAVLQVKDTGTGMSPVTQQHLFEPFVQAAQTIDRSRGGLGLGLTLARGLIELHGGKLTGSSEGEGRGSEFTLTLPRPQAAATPSPEHALPPQGRASPRRVLVVEDNEDTAESLREALELGDHQVEVAHSGPAGVEAARRGGPDIVLCDLGLPELDGYGVARAIRSDPDLRLRSTFLVALSGYALPEDVTRAKQAGFDRHLAKPMSIEALEKVLEEASARAAR